MASTTKEVEKWFLPFIRMCKDGSVERLVGSPNVPHRLTTRKLESRQRTSPSHRTPPSLLASTSQVSTKPTSQNSPSWSTSMAEAFASSLLSPSITNGASIVWLLKLKLLLYQLSIG
ncbi:hypothetical protein CFP56_007801 [Quercus suber]|uniref:Uncharacterized protein n=1 Tax=Quercus suber TaxID=58331 RepID=A0AAW0M5H2_QUESU